MLQTEPAPSITMPDSLTSWEFAPHRLMRNRHLQTVLGIHWPRQNAPYQAKQHRVALEDGDQIMLHEDAPAHGGASQPTVLLIHGLAGCYQSSYMCRNAEHMTAAGYRVFRMDMRGCGAGEGLAKVPNHCGRSSDFVAALNYIANLYPDSQTSIVAYSMGGTITMNMLAEAGESRLGNLTRSFVICPPYDLVHVCNHFRSFWGRPYDRFFVKLIWKQVLDRWQLFPEFAPEKIPSRPKRLRDIDELVIAPSGGFNSADHYYEETSPGPKLGSIQQPLTIFFSEDDPIVPFKLLHQFPRSPAVDIVTVPRGGHLGFLAQRNGDPDFRWLDWRILEWLRAGEKEIEVEQATSEANMA